MIKWIKSEKDVGDARYEILYMQRDLDNIGNIEYTTNPTLMKEWLRDDEEAIIEVMNLKTREKETVTLTDLIGETVLVGGDVYTI